MQNKEMVEIDGFPVEDYLESGNTIYEMLPQIEELADQISTEGFDNLVLLGIGGTYIEFGGLKEILERITDFPVHLVNAARINARHPRYITSGSIVLTSSVSGDTRELVDAVRWLTAENIRVVAMTKPDTPLGKTATHIFPMPKLKTGACEFGYFVSDMFVLRLMKNRGDFPRYDALAGQMKHVFEDLVGVRKAVEKKNRETAAQIALEPYTMYIGSGIVWYEVWLFAMCILEEMQWVRTRPIRSEDFFHGPLELVEKNVPVVLVKGEDEYRVMDERVERFIRKYSDKVIVYDTKEYAMPHFDEEFRPILSQMIATVLLTDRLGYYYQMNTHHNLSYRRYYRQFDY